MVGSGARLFHSADFHIRFDGLPGVSGHVLLEGKGTVFMPNQEWGMNLSLIRQRAAPQEDSLAR
jgi:hypothetical protein